MDTSVEAPPVERAPRLPSSATEAKLAEAASVAALANALLRETQWQPEPLEPALRALAGGVAQAARLRCGDDDLLVPLLATGRCGRQLPGAPLRIGADGVTVPTLDELARLAACAVGVGDGMALGRFATRVSRSRAQLEVLLRRAQASPAATSATAADAFLEAEQGLMFGHPVHPAPRLLGDGEPYDADWLPGPGPGFALHWLAADLDLMPAGAVMAPAAVARALAEDDPLLLPVPRRAGQVRVPLHPLQAAALREDPAAARLEAQGRIEHLGAAGSRWWATASVRSLYAPHARYMLKCSLPLRITNSMRLIRRGELERGPRLRQALDSCLGRELGQRCSGLRVLHEPGWFALRDDDGGLIDTACVILRENPWRRPRRVATPSATGAPCMLGTLCELHPDGRAPWLERTLAAFAGKAAGPDAAVRWLRAYLEAVYRPLVLAHAEYGLLFGAHLQNVLVELADGHPTGLWFRDCQGTGFARSALPRWQPHVPDLELADNLFDDALAVRLGSYYLGVNHVLALIATLALSGLGRERELLAVLRDFLRGLRAEGLRDPALVDWLLDAPAWLAKGNLTTFATDVDENASTTAPLAHYAQLANPLGQQ